MKPSAYTRARALGWRFARTRNRRAWIASKPGFDPGRCYPTGRTREAAATAALARAAIEERQ